MSIAEQQVICVGLCTATAAQVSTVVSLTGVCDYAPEGFTILGVSVTACQLDSFEFSAASADTVLLAIRIQVEFVFEGQRPDGTTFTGSTFCPLVIQTLMSAAEGRQFFQPLRCSADLTCSATDAGVDPATGAQSFVVTVSGSTTCVQCTPDVVNVQRCPVP